MRCSLLAKEGQKEYSNSVPLPNNSSYYRQEMQTLWKKVNQIVMAEQSTLESLLSGLNRDQLQSLVLKLVEQKPSLTETIRVQVRLLQLPLSMPNATPTPRIYVDP